MADLGRWNYAIGFGATFLGLILCANPATPLGRGRGVVVGMLGCFLLGLLWICTYYVFANDLSGIPVMNDLQNWNLACGICSDGSRLHVRHSLGIGAAASSPQLGRTLWRITFV